MKIAFFEIKGWEKTILKRRLKKHSLEFYSEPLTIDNVKKIKTAEIVSVFIYSKMTPEVMCELPKLKLVITRSTGFDHIKIKECAKKGVRVANIPTYGENTVAEHTFALILALSRKIHKSYLRTIQGDYSIEGLKGFDLKGKTLGIIGAGSIGKHVIRIGRGFEMNVLVSDRHEDDFLAEELNFRYTTLAEVLKKSDIVTIHIPHTKENHHIFNKKTFKSMKKGSILINTSRGEIVDTGALIWALDKKILSGVGLDVLEGEKLIKEEKQLLYDKKKTKALEELAKDHILLGKENVVFTPHIAFYSKEALDRIIEETAEIILKFINGKIEEKSFVN